MMKRSSVIALLLFVVTIVACAQEALPNPTAQSNDAVAESSRMSEGQNVSCAATVNGRRPNTPKPKISLSGFVRYDNGYQGIISWSVTDSDGAWSLAGSARTSRGSSRTLLWSGSFWYWLGPFQARTAAGGGCRF